MVFPEIKNCIARWNKAAGVKLVAIKLKANEDDYTLSIYSDRPGLLIGAKGSLVEKYKKELGEISKIYNITHVDINEVSDFVGQEEIDLKQFYDFALDYNISEDGTIDLI